MKKVIILVIGFVLLASLSFAGQVTDNNNGQVGDILISTGQNQGQNSVGTWTDSSTFKGEIGATGEQGLPGIGIDGKDGLNGKDGLGKQGLRGYTGKGLKNKEEAQLEVRIADTKHTTFAVYGIYDFSNQISTVGAKCTIKLGKSYEEKLIEQLLKN